MESQATASLWFAQANDYGTGPHLNLCLHVGQETAHIPQFPWANCCEGGVEAEGNCGSGDDAVVSAVMS